MGLRVEELAGAATLQEAEGVAHGMEHLSIFIGIAVLWHHGFCREAGLLPAIGLAFIACLC